MVRKRSHHPAALIICLALLLALASTGCGGTSMDCSVAQSLTVLPNPASADHAAASPGNKVPFSGFDAIAPGCPLTPGPARTDLKWSVSDPTDVTIGNTANVDYGVATCVNATPGTVTVTATGPNTAGHTISGTATLICK
jgi:hypothetical protein